ERGEREHEAAVGLAVLEARARERDERLRGRRSAEPHRLLERAPPARALSGSRAERREALLEARRRIERVRPHGRRGPAERAAFVAVEPLDAGEEARGRGKGERRERGAPEPRAGLVHERSAERGPEARARDDELAEPLGVDGRGPRARAGEVGRPLAGRIGPLPGPPPLRGGGSAGERATEELARGGEVARRSANVAEREPLAGTERVGLRAAALRDGLVAAREVGVSGGILGPAEERERHAVALACERVELRAGRGERLSGPCARGVDRGDEHGEPRAAEHGIAAGRRDGGGAPRAREIADPELQLRAEERGRLALAGALREREGLGRLGQVVALDEQLRPAEGEPPRAPPDGERARPPEGLGRRRELAARSEHDAAGALEALLVARE